MIVITKNYPEEEEVSIQLANTSSKSQYNGQVIQQNRLYYYFDVDLPDGEYFYQVISEKGVRATGIIEIGVTNKEQFIVYGK